MTQKKEVWRIRKELIPAINDELAKITSSRRYKVKKKTPKYILAILNFWSEWKKLDLDHLSTHDKEYAKSLLRDTMLLVKKESKEDPVDFFINAYGRIFVIPENTILHSTAYDHYLSLAKRLAELIVNTGNMSEFLEFFFKMENEDRYNFSQHAMRLGKQLRYLEKPQVRVSEKAIMKYIQLYDGLSGHMEKIFRLLVGIKKMLDGEEPTYSELKKSPLTNHVVLLNSSPILQDFVAPFDVTIRNAIAHKSYRLNIELQSIIFSDTKRSVTRTFEQFVHDTRELASAARVVSHIDNLVAIEGLNIVKFKLV